MKNTNKKLNRKVFKYIVLVSTVMLIATFTLVMGVLYRFYSNDYVTNLRNEADCIKEAIVTDGTSYIKDLNSQHRLTLIDADGTVIYDNTADSKTLDNHLDRKEVSDAVKNGEGYSDRYSSTLSEKTINVALKLDDGRILRVSDNQHTVISMLESTMWPMILIFLAAIALSFILAARVSKSITSPINRIDLEHPEKQQIYEELYPLIEKIDAQNAQIAKQMQDLRIEHQKQDEMRSSFTANVSHELKTPLTSISGYAEIIRNRIAKEEDIPRFAGKIYDESQRLITLVGDIIKLSQLDGKDIPVRIEPIDLYETCEAVLSHLEMAAKRKNVRLSLSGDRVSINGAEEIVEEMIFNLCDNAIKYNRDGGSVNVTIKQCVDGVELSVKDTGIGISKDDIDHIFERFYRVDKSHSKEIGGTGLGLSIVKHAAMFMGAKVSVDSQINKGTTIRVLF